MEPHEWPDDITKWPVSIAGGTGPCGQSEHGIYIPFCGATAVLVEGVSAACCHKYQIKAATALSSQGLKPANNKSFPVAPKALKALSPARVTGQWGLTQLKCCFHPLLERRC